MSVKTVCRHCGEAAGLPATRAHHCRAERPGLGERRPGPGFVMRWRCREHVVGSATLGTLTRLYLETTSPHLESARAIGVRPPADIARECIAFDRRITRHPRGLA